jgi:multisubunit Na+/H+ antiporter MnhE subunit
MQRMLVIGFVQWIPHTQLSVRTLIGWVVSSVYLGLLVSARPYKRSDVRRVAFAVQFCTVLIFCMVMCIQLFIHISGCSQFGFGNSHHGVSFC